MNGFSFQAFVGICFLHKINGRALPEINFSVNDVLNFLTDRPILIKLKGFSH